MSLLIGAWVIGSVIAAGALITFWDKIASWLKNVAADVVEEAFGYSARNKMQRAVAKIDRVMDKIRNRSTIFVKENRLDTHYLKTEIEAEADVYDIDSKIIDEIRSKKELVQEFEYKI
ncbi:hypothetical protein [Clostridium perfringens]|uniref:hypothetical protein n=1 Tax=Clostridium perfringens TaxID=1502 RepID=UPI0039E73CB1